MTDIPEGFEIVEQPKKINKDIPEGFEVVGEKPQGSYLDAAQDVALTIGGGALGGVVGRAAQVAELSPAGWVYKKLTGQDPTTLEDVDQIMVEIQDYFKNDPDTKRGEEALKYIGKLFTDFDRGVKPLTAGISGVLAGMGNAINPTTPFEPIQTALEMNRRVKEGSVSQVLKDDVYAATGSPTLANISEALPMAAEIGLAAKVTGVKAPKVTETKRTQAKNTLIQKIQEKSGDKDTARLEVDDPNTAGQGYTFDESGQPIIVETPPKAETQGLFGKFNTMLMGEAPKLKNDKFAIEAIKQGFDESVIAAIKASSPIDRAKMLKMTEIMKKIKNNSRYGMTNRPSDVAGDSLMNRVKVILNANRISGRKIDKVAKTLKGQNADFDTPVNNFLSQLNDMGISIDKNGKPNFMGSDIEAVKASEKVVTNILNRMRNTKVPDAYDMHRLKKYIDEQVTWGKGKEGLSGKIEGILKGLRRDIDGKLDETFPEYNQVNSDYAETIQAINGLQDAVSGKKMDLNELSTSKRLGGELRKIMSNYNTRISLLDSLEQIEKTANKYSKTPFEDDLLVQVLYVDELNRRFGTVARTSFQGETAKGVSQALDGQAEITRAAVDKVAEKAEEILAGDKDKKGFQAIEDLLKRDKVN